MLGGCNNGGDCYGIPINGVRYDSPTFAGFSASAGWGEDDYWDMAVRYAGEIHDFKVAAAAAYAEVDLLLDWTVAFSVGCPFSVNYGNTNYFQAGLYIQSIYHGVFLLVNYGNFQFDDGNFPTVVDTLPDLRDLVPQGRSPPELASARRDHSLRRVAAQR